MSSRGVHTFSTQPQFRGVRGFEIRGETEMQIVSVTFHRPVQVGAQTLTFWSTSAHGRGSRAEESDRGVLLHAGTMQGPDNFVPSGLVTLVPWLNVDSMIMRSEAATASEATPPLRERTRTRGRNEVADAE